MTNKFIPAIGTSGYYDLQTPFNAGISVGERYTLKSVRTISDCIANNEDVKKNIYEANGISAVYENDFKADVEILGLQSDRGSWLNVPITYVNCFPDPNGIPYRAIGIMIPINPIPVDTDLTTLLSRLQGVVLSELGISVNPKIVEMSKVILISSDTHLAKQLDRNALRSPYTEAETIARLQDTNQAQLQQIQALEQVIIDQGFTGP